MFIFMVFTFFVFRYLHHFHFPNMFLYSLILPKKLLRGIAIYYQLSASAIIYHHLLLLV